MKKHLIAITALLFLFKISNAQTEKGTQNLGLDMSIGYLKVSNYSGSSTSTATQSQKQQSFNIGPAYSFFVADNMDLGFSLNYSYSSQEYLNSSPNTQDSHGYGAGVFAHRYFLYNGKIGLRTGAHFTYGHDKSTYTYSGTSSFYNYASKTNSYAGGLGLELVAYPAKKVGVTASLAGLSYSHSKLTYAGNMGVTELNTFNFNTVSNGLTMSVFYVLGGK